MTVPTSLTPTYASWQAMKQRTLKPSNSNWPRYGGRGDHRLRPVARFIRELPRRHGRAARRA